MSSYLYLEPHKLEFTRWICFGFATVLWVSGDLTVAHSFAAQTYQHIHISVTFTGPQFFGGWITLSTGY